MFLFYTVCTKDNVNKTIDRFINQCYQSFDSYNYATIELEVDKSTISPLAYVLFDKIDDKIEYEGVIYYTIIRGGDTITIQFKPDKRRTKNLVFDVEKTLTKKQKCFF